MNATKLFCSENARRDDLVTPSHHCQKHMEKHAIKLRRINMESARKSVRTHANASRSSMILVEIGTSTVRWKIRRWIGAGTSTASLASTAIRWGFTTFLWWRHYRTAQAQLAQKRVTTFSFVDVRIDEHRGPGDCVTCHKIGVLCYLERKMLDKVISYVLVSNNGIVCRTKTRASEGFIDRQKVQVDVFRNFIEVDFREV